jgi:hypothetical protein
MAVTGIDHRDTGAEVDPATAFDVPDLCVSAFSANSACPWPTPFGKAATRRAISSALV